ncbi:hypothetical protein [Brevibacillus reuszeri]|uniref:hypothetical protein n=1 Tax=Brevibacillus reuszeri TaxID=54915 RepID=UPI001F24B737|nr:hypothetical protein [Brevibacillus reuszeri]
MAVVKEEVRQAVGRGGRKIPGRLILAFSRTACSATAFCEHHVLHCIDLLVSESLEAPTGITTAIEAFLCKELHLNQKDAASSFITLLT